MLTEGGRNETPLTVTIRDLREQSQGDAVALTVVLSAGTHTENRTLIIGTADYARLKPKKGTVSEETFDALETAARIFGAMRKGENLLAYGANTRQMLVRKIMRHGYSREEAETATERLGAMGLIDEESDMRREVEKCLRKLWGEGRIRNQLYTKGFDRETMELLPQMLEEVDFAENCRRLIVRQYGGAPTNGDEERRMVAGLYRYGYRMDEIRTAVRALRRPGHSEE